MARSSLSLGLYRAWLTTKAQSSLLRGEEREGMKVEYAIMSPATFPRVPARVLHSLSSGVTYVVKYSLQSTTFT